MRPELRSILAPLLALVGVSAFVVYISSCAGKSGPDPEAPPAAAEKTADGEPEKAAKLNSFGGAIPSEKELMAPKKPKPASGVDDDDRPGQAAGRRVAEVLDSGCSTKVVKGLSKQIIEEGNCIQPGAYAKVPKLKNVTLGSAVFPYMRTPARDALVDAAKHGKRYDLRVNSMLRTVAQQYLLYDWYQRGRCGIKLAAKPGRSNHQSGLAVDISEPGTWKKIMRKYGFRWMGKKDRWHFDYTGEKAKRGLDIKAFQRLHNRNNPDDRIPSDGDWGKTTARALRQAPADGYAVGAVCRFGDGKE
jgi:D-alanyl-D-alanine carboxypeptidase